VSTDGGSFEGGASAAGFARTPRGALAAVVISHLALDCIPHTDHRLDNRKGILADLATATVLTATLARRHRFAAAGAFGGVLPGLTMAAELRTGLRLTLPLHHANHTSIEPPVAIGVLTSLVTASVLLTAFTGPGDASPPPATQHPMAFGSVRGSVWA
jgi:hypothetical protein